MDLNPLVLWSQMTILNKGVIIILICLSVWSLYVCVERLIVFRKARRQSLLFARQATALDQAAQRHRAEQSLVV